MRAYEVDPEVPRLVRLSQLEPLLPARPFTLYEYTIPDLSERALRALRAGPGGVNPVYTGRANGHADSVEERYLEPLAAAKLIAGLYSRVLDPLRFSSDSGISLPSREEIFERFARTLMSPRLQGAVESVAANITYLRDLDTYQHGLGSAVAHWMQYLAYEALNTSITRPGYADGADTARLRSALYTLRDSATVLDRYKALARRRI